MGIQTEYRGYTIRYSENEDKWNCYDVGVTADTLSKVKAKIDRLHLKLRKEAAVDAYEISDYNGLKVTPCRVIDYAGEVWSSGWNKPKELQGHEVQSMADRNGDGRPTRNKIRLSNIAPLGPETDAAIVAARAKEEALDIARREFNEAVAAIPRLTISDIEDLRAAADQKIEEDA